MTRKKIVIIEDHDDNREMIGVMLAGWYDVAAYPDGASGLQAIRESKPDIVLLDVGLPDMGGLEVVRAIRSDPALCGLVVVAVTGYAMAADREKHLAAGFDEHIAKPILDHEGLHETLERTFQSLRTRRRSA